MSRDIFVTRSSQELPGLNLAFMLGFKDKFLVPGEVGIEIEVEGKRLPGVTVTPPPEPWVYKADHSLRGEESGEYVLAKPVMFKEVSKALNKLWDAFEKGKTVIDDSNRTSVHIHLNCQRWHINRIAAFAALHFILEEVLTEWCGEHRVGNLFCLRAKDAEAIITWLKKFIECDGATDLPDSLHYAGFNTQALLKFGSIEIRTLRGVSNPNVIQDWVAIYERLYTLSDTFKDPTEICDWFSAEGPTAFFERILGPVTGLVRNGVTMTSEEISDSMYAGIRRAQDICFCRDWSLFKKLEVEDNPFGLSKKKLIEKAMAAHGFHDEDVSVTGLSGPMETEFDPEYDDMPDDPPSSSSQLAAAAALYQQMSHQAFNSYWGSGGSGSPSN